MPAVKNQLFNSEFAIINKKLSKKQRPVTRVSFFRHLIVKANFTGNTEYAKLPEQCVVQ